MNDGKYEYTEYSPKKGVIESVKEKLHEKGELLGIYKRESCNAAFYRIRFYECGHECYIRSGKNLECNHKDCVSKKMSAKRKIAFNTPEHKEKLSKISKEFNARPEVKEKHRKFFSEYWSQEENRQLQSEKKKKYFSNQENRKAQSERTKEYFVNTENREKVSESLKKVFSDRDFKMKYLEKRAEIEREKRNRDEVLFMDMLEKLNVEYVWQVPILTDYGKGFVFDFYIPCVDFYVNIDGSIHGIDWEYTNSVIEKKKSEDKELDDYCNSHGINLVHLSVKALRSSDFNLKEVISL